MAAKKNNYIEEDLAWLEQKAKDIKELIDKTNYGKIRDRKVVLQGVRGDSEVIAATIEQQQKAYRDTLKEFGLIMEVINNLREREESKVETRGKVEMSQQASDWLKNRKG